MNDNVDEKVQVVTSATWKAIKSDAGPGNSREFYVKYRVDSCDQLGNAITAIPNKIKIVSLEYCRSARKLLLSDV